MLDVSTVYPVARVTLVLRRDQPVEGKQSFSRTPFRRAITTWDDSKTSWELTYMAAEAILYL